MKKEKPTPFPVPMQGATITKAAPGMAAFPGFHAALHLFSALRRFPRRSGFARLLWSFCPELLAAMAFSGIANLLLLAPTLYMLQAFDRVLPAGSGGTLLAITCTMAFFLAALAFAERVRAKLLSRTAARLDMAANPVLVARAFAQKTEDPASQPEEGLQDLAALRQFLSGQGLAAFLDMPFSPVFLAALFFLHPLLGWLSIAFAALMAALAFWAAGRLKAPMEAVQAARRENGRWQQGRLRCAEALSALGMLPALRGRAARQRENLAHLGLCAMEQQQRMLSLAKCAALAQQSLALAAGALLAIQGEISPAAMVAANALAGRAVHPFANLPSAWKAALAAKDAFLRLESAWKGTGDAHGAAPAGLALPANLASTEGSKESAGPCSAAALCGAPSLQRLAVPANAAPAAESFPAPTASAAPSGSQAAGAFCASRLSLFVPGRDTPVISGLSFELPAGGFAVGIAGPSGSGKSAFLRCLMGIWPAAWQEGEACLAGIAAAALPGALRGYLPQDAQLFAGTVAENIARLGTPSPPAVAAACRKAGAHGMVQRLPAGYDTPISPGQPLSGGQRQRIALARALYGDPMLIALDEPDASLDAEGCAALGLAIESLKAEGKAVFFASHRPQTLGHATHLLRLAPGSPPAFMALQKG